MNCVTKKIEHERGGQMRLASHEVRWFFDGDLEPDLAGIVDWFRERGKVRHSGDLGSLDWPEHWREDIYLVIRGQGDMGIKWRQERINDEIKTKLEFKGLSAALGEVVFGSLGSGKVERWIKWSYKDDEVPKELGALFTEQKSSTTVTVKKKRLSRKIRLDAFGNDEEVPVSGPGSFVDRGLIFELTQVRVENQPYWTLGFEAFPHDSDLHEAFFKNVGLLLHGFPANGGLHADDSYAYPAWLQHFI